MKWSEEALKYKPVTDQDVVHFAPPAKKAMAIERYNRAVRQIEKGNVDMAAIALKSLTAEYPAFVQAAQLNACCQMIWRDTAAAARALTGLLKRSMLTHAEREKTTRYLSLIQRTEQTVRQRQQKLLPTDHLPHFNMNRAAPTLLETTGPMQPMAVATKAEVDALMDGRTYIDPDAEPRPQRRVTYGSSLRHSESLSSEKLRAARAAAEQRAHARAEAERRRLAREEAKARQRKRLEEQRKRLEAQRRAEEKERLAAEAQAKAAAERAAAEARAKAEAEAAAAVATVAADRRPDPAAEAVLEAPAVIRPVQLSEASLHAHAAEKTAAGQPAADDGSDFENARPLYGAADGQNSVSHPDAPGTAAIRPFRISAKPLPAGVRAPKIKQKTADGASEDGDDPAGLVDAVVIPAPAKAESARPVDQAKPVDQSSGSAAEAARVRAGQIGQSDRRVRPTAAERMRRFRRHCLVAAIVVLTTIVLVTAAWLLRSRIGAWSNRTETVPAGTISHRDAESVLTPDAGQPELSSVAGIHTTAADSS